MASSPRARALPVVLLAASMVLGGCFVPVPIPMPTNIPAGRDSSMTFSEATCPADPALGQEFQEQINPAAPNQRLLTEAFRRVVNHERCRRGLAPLALSQAAVQAATGQARTMAKHDFMGHHSPVRGRETLERRLAAEQIAGYRLAAENVARSAASILSPREDLCLGPSAAAPDATYAELARGLFQMWISSEGHRENILEPRFRALGSGMAVNPGKYQCGEVAAAMVFVG